MRIFGRRAASAEGTGARVLPLRPPDRAEALSDEALLAAVAVGDGGALAALFRRHHARVHRFCARIAGDADAEDLVQETFVAAWVQAPRWRGSASARAWLYAIAANLARKRWRGGARRAVAFDALRVVERRDAPGPERQVADREALERLARAIEALPHDLRVAFVLCEIEGVSGTEAAKALGVRPGTLWRRLHEARRRLLPVVEGEER